MVQWLARVSLGVSVMLHAAGQTPGQVNTLDRRVSVYDAKDSSIAEALRQLVAETGRTIVVGLERVPTSASASSAEPRITLHIEHATLGEILKKLCAQDSRYTFADVGAGVINVYPVVEASEPAAILGLPLDRVDIKVREWPSNLFGRILEVAPELGTYLNTRAREHQMRTSRLPAGTPGVIMTTNVQRPLIEMHLRKTSVRGALNTIAAYTLTHPITDEAGNVLGSPTGWEFRFIIDPDAATGLGGHPQWMPFPIP